MDSYPMLCFLEVSRFSVRFGLTVKHTAFGGLQILNVMCGDFHWFPFNKKSRTHRVHPASRLNVVLGFNPFAAAPGVSSLP